ncbi:MAG: SUMF1/EgtB/PvdO family nonheme iron enzyme [Fibrobacter sp.]|nr:SUMF1/EgtB/PvdO family nonheme iron enzyme [Fibrobacter sp.]
MNFIKISILLLSFFSVCIQVSFAEAAKTVIPNWLDTVAPVIKIQPEAKYHKTLFNVTFSSNERATIYFSVGSPSNMVMYSKPFTIALDGTYVVYYYGEDDFGNKTSIDSITYFLDSRIPSFRLTPPPGTYSRPIYLRVKADEPVKYFLEKKESGEVVSFKDSVKISKYFEGYVIVEDFAGNRKRSELVRYDIDSSKMVIDIKPSCGVINRFEKVQLSVPTGVTAFYSLDPLAPPEWFHPYSEPVKLPYGMTIFRYYGKNNAGEKSDIFRARFIVDTIAPKIIINTVKGTDYDTLYMTTKEAAVIRYTKDKIVPTEQSNIFNGKIIVPHQGLTTIKAKAWDEAGNTSEIVTWEYKYDFKPPIVSVSDKGGVYTRPLKLYLKSNEPGKILYTLDGTPVTKTAYVYTKDGITITKNDTTWLRFKGIDEAGNESEEVIEKYYLDTYPPVVKVRINGKVHDGVFTVSLTANEPAQIYYTVDGSIPGRASAVYKEPLLMRSGQVLKYFAVDQHGNSSEIAIMNELSNPMVSANPPGGIYRRQLDVSFASNSQGDVYWRNLPDTLFKKLEGTLTLKEGMHSIEYYLNSLAGIKSAIRREEYNIDLHAPRVELNLRKGNDDSVIVFFNCSENASIYYTLDGTNPFISPTVKTAGNKYVLNNDRIVVKRAQNTQLAFYAEDVAGNQSSVSVIDLFSPHAVPNVPSGPDKLYNRILSITLNAFDQSTIYFERHGKLPTTSSPIFNAPLTLTESDTIMAFVIDASGFKGPIDTFIYRIDMPPTPHFEAFPDTAFYGSEIILDATSSIDKETTADKLRFKWDFDGDGVFDTDTGDYRKVSHIFEKPGSYHTKVMVIDENKRSAVFSKVIMIKDRCPDEMISVIDSTGHYFCIDRFEWPNIKDTKPLTSVSWVEAKMNCIDAGKRLCTADEWVLACNAGQKYTFPYGNSYDPKRCPTEGKTIWKSGQFSKCNPLGVDDMIGNVWEWVDDKNGDYPVMLGGSFRFGKNANCAKRTKSTIASRADETGFRCCK